MGFKSSLDIILGIVRKNLSIDKTANMAASIVIDQLAKYRK